jgi:hypothetical protein
MPEPQPGESEPNQEPPSQTPEAKPEPPSLTLGTFISSVVDLLTPATRGAPEEQGLVAGASLSKARATGAPIDYRATLHEWIAKAEVRAEAQQIASSQDGRVNTILGWTVTGLAAASGTAVLGTLLTSREASQVFIASVIALAAAVLSGIHTQQDYAGKAQGHRDAAARFNRLVNDLTVALVDHEAKRPLSKARLNDLIDRMEVLDKLPGVSNRIFKQAQGRVAQRQ